MTRLSLVFYLLFPSSTLKLFCYTIKIKEGMIRSSKKSDEILWLARLIILIFNKINDNKFWYINKTLKLNFNNNVSAEIK